MAWMDRTFGDLARSLRWSYLPPLMVYFAAGVSGLTAVVGTFFVKDHLGLSAAFLAGLGFWAGLPWVLKMPVGHIVDLMWRRKSQLVMLGAGLIAVSLMIMYALIAHKAAMTAIAPAESWFIAAALLAPTGYVIQDVVADAMTVEAVPALGADGAPLSEAESRAAHVTMQTLGRFAIISGFAMVAAVNIWIFSGTETWSVAEKAVLYARVYLTALAIPVISISGVVLHGIILRRQAAEPPPPPEISPDWQILGGGLVFVAFTMGVGLTGLPYGQEVVFAGSMLIICYLISRLIRALEPEQARTLIGTAVIVFVFRAVPLPGPGQSWFEIDRLGFDESFLSILSFITSVLTLAGLILLRPLMAQRSIAYIVVLLTLAAAVMALPNIGLYYGVQDWTAARTNGVVDARFIAILDTAIESPLGQIAMAPMLAWIARNAPAGLKATFFAVMASFTNLALSASALSTRYLNEVFVVTREVRENGVVTTPEDYSELGWLLIVVALIGLAAPLVTVALVQASRWRTRE
jgi:hypothetical protein